MRRATVMAGVLLGLGGCSTAPPSAPPPPPPPAVAPPPPTDPGPQPSADSCGAKEVQNLVGRPRSEIPVPVRPELQRVACTTCAVTMDFNPNRLNFFFDAQTGLIKEVRCG
ncbi:MAG: peptidase inhibitor I78 [Phenylobacterium sp.]|uniref:I78 family peptidase inhibitor n=1 Tax=Phenylobacterium sp. TaxID=1871053 RepID=UPI00120F77C2|nr:I78 family peptidase inhibitor [Phenylobacterium sp.]TAJ74299.1 MAG: peptidase inhibitor I78 [Phenylobacterium sp.]